MTTNIECPRESDVLDALASARWPNRVERELSDHVASCVVCQDVITVASAIQTDQWVSRVMRERCSRPARM